MRRTYLGDSVDFWKRGLIEYLRCKDVIGQPEVVPMITDARPWSHDELEAYVKILGVSISHLRGAERFTHSNRRQYFCSIKIHGDVFVDPDTGVAASEPKATAKHIQAEECGQLLHKDAPNIVMVYQHAQRKADWAKGQLEILRSTIDSVQAFAYQSSVVGMLFLSWNADRLKKVQGALSKLLGPTASGQGEFQSRIVD